MVAAARRQQILKLIEERNSISFSEVGQLLDVSHMTIRRDLRFLANRGLLERVHGGALLRRGRSYVPPDPPRATEQIRQKELIGRSAAALVHEGIALRSMWAGSTLKRD